MGRIHAGARGRAEDQQCPSVSGGGAVMREMAFLKPDGSLDACTVGIAQAYMQFPDELDNIEEDIQSFRIWAANGYRSTNLGRHLKDSFKSAETGGIIAGSMLFTMVQFHQ